MLPSKTPSPPSCGPLKASPPTSHEFLHGAVATFADTVQANRGPDLAMLFTLTRWSPSADQVSLADAAYLLGFSDQSVSSSDKRSYPSKGYGFVVLSDGSGDPFLHASALAGIGVTNLQPGETLEFRVTLGQRGPQVSEVIGVDRSTAVPAGPRRRSFGSQPDRQPSEARVQQMGTVKWYNSTKGFGFVVLDGSGKEVFVHSSALKRAAIMRLNEGQRVFVGVAEGRKGPEVSSIQMV